MFLLNFFLLLKVTYEEVMDSYGGISIEVGEELDRLDEEQILLMLE